MGRDIATAAPSKPVPGAVFPPFAMGSAVGAVGAAPAGTPPPVPFAGPVGSGAMSAFASAFPPPGLSHEGGGGDGQSCWAHLPSELLRDILGRLEASEGQWPSRRSVVACAGVCSSWREIVRELVKTPEESGVLTFPVSLKQPGPRDAVVQCFIRRDRATSSYYLYLGVPQASTETGKFLLAARKCRRPTSTDYVLSLNGEDMSRGAATYVGKLRSNFLGTKFTIYDAPSAAPALLRGSPPPPPPGCGPSAPRPKSKQVSPRLPSATCPIAGITYELNVLGTRGPRRMSVTMNTIPAASLDPGGSVPFPLDLTTLPAEEGSPGAGFHITSPKAKVGAVADCGACGTGLAGVSAECDCGAAGVGAGAGAGAGALLSGEALPPPLVLRNKAPRWHEQLQCWCLNFKGRVTVASVKNFQLVAAQDTDKPPAAGGADHDKVLLQFGKIGKDMFTMDYRYPLSAYQSFAICLSSFDTKLACE